MTGLGDMLIDARKEAGLGADCLNGGRRRVGHA